MAILCLRGERLGRWLWPGGAALLLALSMISCTDAGGDESQHGGGAAAGGMGGDAGGCAAGELTLEDGSCRPAGLPPDMACPPGELPLDDGGCQLAGVASGACATGFEHDSDRGCEPILPSSPCPPGQIAVPGDEACRPIAPCGAAPWGDIPVDGTTQHVDQQYGGGNSDGSASFPWTTIQQAIDAAAQGAVVAVAAGDYLEDVVITGKAVTLWGRCPELVEIEDTGNGYPSVLIMDGVDATTVRGVALTGPTFGLVQVASQGVVLEEAWVHHNASAGVQIQSTAGDAAITVRGTLIEGNAEFGMCVIGAQASLDGSVIRDTQADAEGWWGRGLYVDVDSDSGASSQVAIARSLFERNAEIGLYVNGSSLLVEGSVVRDTQLDGAGMFGFGVAVVAEPLVSTRSDLTVRGSLLDANHSIGVYIEGSDGIVDSTVVRDTALNGQGKFGYGIDLQPDPVTGERAQGSIVGCLVELNHSTQIGVIGSDATLVATAVRDALPSSLGHGGQGINVLPNPTTDAPSSLAISSCLVERSHEGAIVVASSDVTIDATVLRETSSDSAGKFGRTLVLAGYPGVAWPSTATLSSCLIEDSVEAAVSSFGGHLDIDFSLIRNTQPNLNGHYGDGVLLIRDLASGSATLRGTLIENSARAAISSFGASISLTGLRLSCQSFDLAGEVAAVDGHDFLFDDLGGNACGCGPQLASCKVLSANLSPPDPLEPEHDL